MTQQQGHHAYSSPRAGLAVWRTSQVVSSCFISCSRDHSFCTVAHGVSLSLLQENMNIPSGYFNIGMENDPFTDGLPITNGDFPWLC